MAGNDEQTAFLNYFLDDGNSFDYAVLIDAPWGSGKTHFLKDYLSRKYPAGSGTRVSDHYLWVSFFGKTKAEEVSDALFSAAHPLLSSKWAALGATAVSQVLKKTTGVDLQANKGVDAVLPDIKAKLVVFDDLERTGMKPADALGLINGFVESGAFKVIVIANQSAFGADKDYRAQKEKVIGRTVSVMADAGEVLSALTAALQFPAARTAVEVNRDDILSVFRASGLNNLRSLRAALNDFDRLVANFDKRLAGSPAALRQLALYVVVVGMEVRADRLSGDKLGELLAPEVALARKLPEEIVPLRSLMERYPQVVWEAPLVAPGLLGRLIVSGALALTEIDEGLARHLLIAEPSSLPLWSAFYSWMKQTITGYQGIRREVLQAMQMREIVHPGEILHIAGAAIAAGQSGDYLFPDPVVAFSKYIDELVVEGKLDADMRVFDFFQHDGWASTGYQQSHTEEFISIRLHLRDAVMAIHRQAMTVQAQTLFAQLKNGDGYASLFEACRDKSDYGSTAILHNIPVAEFADLLIDDGCLNSQLLATLDRRYQLGRAYPELAEEAQWLDDLGNEIAMRQAAAPTPFNDILSKRLAGWFPQIKAYMGVISEVAERETAEAATSTN
jgi:hypothetical protein